MFFPKSAQFSSPRMAVRITDDFGPDTWLTLLAAHAAGRCCFCCACAVGEAGANAGVDFALCNIEGDNSRLLWHPPVPSLLVRAPRRAPRVTGSGGCSSSRPFANSGMLSGHKGVAPSEHVFQAPIQDSPPRPDHAQLDGEALRHLRHHHPARGRHVRLQLVVIGFFVAIPSDARRGDEYALGQSPAETVKPLLASPQFCRALPVRS